MKKLIKSILIFIPVLILTTGAEDLRYAKVGDTVVLGCPGISSNNYLYWKFGRQNELQLAWRNSLGGKGFTDDKNWKDKLSFSGDTLNIKNIQEGHFGTFICEQATNVQTSTIATYQLLRVDVNTTALSPLLPGDFLSLSCKAEAPQGHKMPEIYWVTPKGDKKGNNQREITVKATSQHDGTWTCVVKNYEKEHKFTVTIMVVDFSPAPSRPLYTSKFQPLTIPCSISTHISWDKIRARGIQGVYWQFLPKLSSGVISNSPQRLFNLSLEDHVNWKEDKPRGLKPVSDLQKGNLSLIRSQWKDDDRGDYMCIMQFKNGGNLNRTVHVEVLKIIASPGTNLISGQQLNLTCSLGHHLPSDLQVKWTLPGQSSYQSLKSENHSLHFTIPEVGVGDSGKWGCALWQGSTRLTSDVIMLNIEPRLSVWMLVTICSAAVIIILLLVLIFIFCRRRQRKRRHLRHRLCQCKNPKPKGFYRT